MIDPLIISISNFVTTLPIKEMMSSIIILLIGALILNILYEIIKRVFLKVVSKTKSSLDDELVKISDLPVRIFLVLLCLYLSIVLVFNASTIFIVGLSLLDVFVILFIINVAFGLDRLTSTAILWYSREVAPNTNSTLDNNILPLVNSVFSILIYGIALMIILSRLNIDISPLVAGLGVGGIAAAFALQTTLTNFISGIYLLIDKPIKPGNFIKVNDYQGYVEEVGWRSTRIKTWDNNLVIIPNSKMSDSIITNYNFPSDPAMLVYSVAVDYDSDVDDVYDALKMISDKVLKMDDNVLQSNSLPVIRFSKMNESALLFKIIYQAKGYTRRFSIEENFNREIFKEFKKRGIVIPFNQTTISFKGDVPVKDSNITNKSRIISKNVKKSKNTKLSKRSKVSRKSKNK